MDVDSAIRIFVKEMITDEVRQQLALALAAAGVERPDQRLMSQEEAANYAGVDFSAARSHGWSGMTFGTSPGRIPVSSSSA
jgi:hypothetical protein